MLNNSLNIAEFMLHCDGQADMCRRRVEMVAIKLLCDLLHSGLNGCFKGEDLQSSVWVHAFHASVFFLFCAQTE